MEQHEIFQNIQQLLASQQFGVLATQGEDYPYCSLVGYAVTGKGKELLFATLRPTRKFANLTKNPRVSLLIDSQTNRADDIKDAQALTALGTAHEVNTEENPECLTAYLSKHPHLEEFVNAPNCALIKIKVETFMLVSNFQHVMEWKKSPGT